MGLLALVAAAGRKGVTREKILGILWAETGEEDARHTLSQNLYSLKRETGRDWVVGTPELRLHPEISSDIGEFQDALAADDLPRAASLYAGPFLEGFYLPGVPEFERWVEDERARIHTTALRAIERLASREADAAHHHEAIHWWHRLTEIEPLSARFAAGYMKALAAAGDRAGALAFARAHEEVVRRELDAELEPAIRDLVATLRTPAALSPTPVATALPPRPAPAPPESAESLQAPLRPSPTPPAPRTETPVRPLRRWLVPAAAALVAIALGLRAILTAGSPPPVLAVGLIRSTDATAAGSVLRDMLATSLGGVQGLQVVANSRLVELMPRAPDSTAVTITDAARRAGAGEIIEGEVSADRTGLVLTLRRVTLKTGVVQQGYVVRAADRFAVVDSATAAIARDFHLARPASAVTEIRTSSPAAYALYDEGLRSFYKYDAAAAHRLMSAALERDSSFAMAAYYAWRASQGLLAHEETNRAMRLAHRLAPRTIERERLLIEGSVAALDAPISQALAIAETLTVRYPTDPDGQALLGEVRFAEGDWAGSVAAYNRAALLDSAAGVSAVSYCRLCGALSNMSRSYLWWDSGGAAERTARRLLALKPDDHMGWNALVEPLLRAGRRPEAEDALTRGMALSGVRFPYRFYLDRDLIRWGRLEELDRELIPELLSPDEEVRGEARWLLLISLRNQGRFREVLALATVGQIPGSRRRIPDAAEEVLNARLVLQDLGRAREAASGFLKPSAPETAADTPLGVAARFSTFRLTNAGAALAASGDTARLRGLVDTVEALGRLSSFGRDRGLHHFLRGLLLQRQGRHAEAVEEFRGAIFSTTDGYTRVNLEMARSLMVLGRVPEAIEILQPALRGGVDGSNTYVTHTELHEALAEAFDLAAKTDSARAHFEAVERAWRRADPELKDRYARVRTWLDSHQRQN